MQSRNCLEVGGVWIDDGFNPKMTTVTVKAMSEAYFRILEKHPQVREVFQLGNHLVWVTPSGTALIIDQNDGQENDRCRNRPPVRGGPEEVMVIDN